MKLKRNLIFSVIVVAVLSSLLLLAASSYDDTANAEIAFGDSTPHVDGCEDDCLHFGNKIKIENIPDDFSEDDLADFERACLEFYKLRSQLGDDIINSSEAIELTTDELESFIIIAKAFAEQQGGTFIGICDIDECTFEESFENTTNSVQAHLKGQQNPRMSLCMRHRATSKNECLIETYDSWKCVFHSNCTIWELIASHWSAAFH
jgi:hypothetical protein